MLIAAQKDHLIICGMGNVGFRVVEQLLEYEERVVCIEINTASPFIAELHRLKVPVLIGNATNIEVLQQAQIDKAKAILAVTDNDLANIEVVLTAKEINSRIKTVLRMFDQKLAAKISNSLLVDAAFSASALAAPVFAQAALSENILASFNFNGATVNAYQLSVDASSSFVGHKVDDIRKDYEVTVLMQQRGEEMDWNPDPEIILEQNDVLLLMAENSRMQVLLEKERGLRLWNPLLQPLRKPMES